MEYNGKNEYKSAMDHDYPLTITSHEHLMLIADSVYELGEQGFHCDDELLYQIIQNTK